MSGTFVGGQILAVLVGSLLVPSMAFASDGFIPMEDMDPSVEERVMSATAADVSCAVSERTPRYLVLYTRPLGFPDRSAEVVPYLQREVYRLSAFVDANAMQDDPNARARLRVQCDAIGEVDVRTLELDEPEATDNLSTIARDLSARGLVDSTWSSNARRLLVYHDGTYAGLAGIARFKPGSSDDLSIRSYLNGAGSVAVQFAQWDDIPTWEVLLHEILHTMGATQLGAPEATGGGHCSSGLDVMCVGAPRTNLRCSTLQLDCGRDTYFNAGVVSPDSWLATHWNVGHPRNRYLDHGSRSIDATLPGPPDAVVAAPSGDGYDIDVTWGDGAVDDDRIDHYVVEWDVYIGDDNYAHFRNRRSVPADARRMTLQDIGAARTLTVSVRSVDPAGNASRTIWASGRTASDAVSPTIMARAPRLVEAREQQMAVEWDAASDDVGVAEYRIMMRLAGSSYGNVVATVRGLNANIDVGRWFRDTPIELTVVACDAARNCSTESAPLVTSTLPDATPPTRPAVTRLTIERASLYLTMRLDDDAVTQEVSVTDATTGAALGTIAWPGRWQQVMLSTDPLSNAPQVPGSRQLSFRVVAIDARGNRSEASDPVTATTPPAIVRDTGTSRSGVDGDGGARPKRPAMRRRVVGLRSIRIEWRHAPRSAQIRSIVVVGCSTPRVRRTVLRAPARVVVLAQLRSRTSYCIRAYAVDAHGRWSAPRKLRIRTAAPRRRVR